MSSIKNNIETTIKTLENFYVNQHDLEDVAIALYHVASEYARMFALQSNICNDIDDIIATAVEDILNDISKLVANSDSAHAFRKWCCYRLKTIIRNKAKDHYRQETAHLRKCVSGDSIIPGSENITLFSMLKGPDDEYFENEKEKVHRKRQLLFFRRTAEIVANECPSYTLGYWSLLGSAFARRLNIPALYLSGEFDSFSYILQRIGVREDYIVRLMDALVRSQANFIRNKKSEEQSRKRVSDYRAKAKKVLRQHTELKEYIVSR